MINNQGRARLKNGEELIYVSGNEKLRGYHGVKVEVWSKPNWMDDETDILIKMAEFK